MEERYGQHRGQGRSQKILWEGTSKKKFGSLEFFYFLNRKLPINKKKKKKKVSI
jgi:hypothetical protein